MPKPSRSSTPFRTGRRLPPRSTDRPGSGKSHLVAAWAASVAARRSSKRARWMKRFVRAAATGRAGRGGECRCATARDTKRRCSRCSIDPEPLLLTGREPPAHWQADAARSRVPFWGTSGLLAVATGRRAFGGPDAQIVHGPATGRARSCGHAHPSLRRTLTRRHPRLRRPRRRARAGRKKADYRGFGGPNCWPEGGEVLS